jgi:transposase
MKKTFIINRKRKNEDNEEKEKEEQEDNKEVNKEIKDSYMTLGDLRKIFRNYVINSKSEKIDKERGINTWVLETPYDIRDKASDEFLNAYSNAKEALFQKKIKKFSFRFKSKKLLQQSSISIDHKHWCKLSEKQINDFKKNQKIQNEKRYVQLKEKQKKRQRKGKNRDYWDKKSTSDKFVNCYVPFKTSWDGNPLRSTEPIPENIDNETKIIQMKDRKYYLVYLQQIEEKPKTHQKDPFISLDPGEKNFLVGYSPTGSVVSIGENEMREGSKLYEQCKKVDELISKRDKLKNDQKVSKNKKRNEIRQLILSIIRQRRRVKDMISDLHRKASKWLCENYQVILLPSFQTSKMVSKLHNKVARGLLTLSHYRFKQLLKAKARVYSDVCVLDVEEEYTSKTCGFCGHVKNKNEQVCDGNRVYKCNVCQSQIDRDLNGARNIWLKYVTEHKIC